MAGKETDTQTQTHSQTAMDRQADGIGIVSVNFLTVKLLFIYLFVDLFISWFIYVFVYLFICLFMYLFIEGL